MNLRGFWLWMTFLVGVTTFLSCSESKTADTARQLTAVRALSRPSGARILEQTESGFDGGSLATSWSLAVPMSWEGYARWVQGRFHGFRQTRRDATSLRFSREMEGDLQSVDLARGVEYGDGVTVQVIVRAQPF